MKMLFWTLLLLMTFGVISGQHVYNVKDNSTDDLEVRVTALEIEVENMENVIDRTKDSQDLEDSVAAIFTRLSDLEDANNILQEEIGTLQNTVVSHEETIANLEEENNILEEEVRALQNTVATHKETTDVSFLATFDVFTLFPSDPIAWNYAVLNSGGHYDTTTGIYTVPLDGTYEFYVQIESQEDFSCSAYFIVDGDKVSYTFHYDPDYLYQTASMNVLLPLVAGQQVWVEPNEIRAMYGASSNGMRSWFSGHLVDTA